MTSIAQLVGGLESRGIVLSVSDGEMRYRAPKQALTDADRDGLRARRDEVIGYLQAREAGRTLRGLPPVTGPLTASIVQEMWYRFGGGPHEGQPVAINIGMAGMFRDVTPAALADAIRQVIAHHDTLRTHIVVRGEALELSLNPADAFEVALDDLTAMDAATARETARSRAQQFCSLLNPVEGQWLTRACVMALPGGEAVAAISASHIVTDAASRNIVLEEIQDILDRGRGNAGPERPTAITYNEYSLAERAFFEGAQGELLIDYWRRWYAAQPGLAAPSDGTPLVWGAGERVLYNFTIPRRVLDGIGRLATQWGATPFLVQLGIFCWALARWSGQADFPLRILGDKRTTREVAGTVGLMYCADAIAVHATPDQDFATLLRGLLREYDGALATRPPTLHYYPPQCVRPDIAAPKGGNRIPAVFNYYSGGTARERQDAEAAPDTSAALPWPPQMQRVVQMWTRPSAPLFLHLSDQGTEMAASLHFYAEVVRAADQQAFIAILFQVFAEIVPV